MRPESIDCVSVAIDINGEKILKKINLKQNVSDIITNLIEEFNLVNDNNEYGLRITQTNIKVVPQRYVTDENKFTLISNGCELRLCESPENYLNRIFHKITLPDQRELGLTIINDELCDDVLLKMIVELEWDQYICNELILEESLSNFEKMVCFNIILKLLKREYLSNIDSSIVKILIDYLKYVKKVNYLYSSILLLRLLLLNEHHFDYIISEIKIVNDLMPILQLKCENQLKIVVLSFINFSAKLASNEQQRQTIIETMNQKICLETIFQFVININELLSDDLQKELHIYQTVILGLYGDKYLLKIDKDDIENMQLQFLNADMSILLKENQFSKTLSMVFDDDTIDNRLHCDTSNNAVIQFNQTSTEFDLSLASLNISNSIQLNDDYINEDIIDDGEINTISQLTVDFLVYFKQNYPQSFYIVMLEENERGLGLLKAGEHVCSIVCNLLRIGKQPEKNSTLYCPLLFNASSDKQFLPELCCRLIWLLARTRVEMKAKTVDDQYKVLTILKKQLLLVLNSKPKTYKQLMAAMKYYSYSTITAICQNEHKLKWKHILKNNANVLLLSEQIQPDIVQLIKEKRFTQMQTGTKLLRIECADGKKSKPTWIYMRLSPNRQQLIVNDWSVQYEICSFEKTLIQVTDIKYLVTGNACVHVKEHRVKRPEFAFSLLLDDDKNSLYNFEVISEQDFDLWTDGINALMNKSMSSNEFEKDKAELMELELMVRLLDLENVDIPQELPPPVPELPKNYNFKIIV